MMRLLIAVGVGYVLGTKAGRSRYEQISKAAKAVAASPATKKVIDGLSRVPGVGIARAVTGRDVEHSVAAKGHTAAVVPRGTPLQDQFLGIGIKVCTRVPGGALRYRFGEARFVRSPRVVGPLLNK